MIKINSYTVDENSPIFYNPESWDQHWWNQVVAVARNSKCLSRKIGAIIVLDKTRISDGYNGPPRNIFRCDERWYADKNLIEAYNQRIMSKGRSDKVFKNLKLEEKVNKCPRRVMGFNSGEGLEWCVAGHAEENAIVNAAREGLHSLKFLKMYMSCGIPCSPCMVKIINSGIEELICSSKRVYDKSAQYLLDNSGIRVRLFDFIKE